MARCVDLSLRTSPTTVAVLVFDNFSNHCLANTIEPLRAANQYAGCTLYEWQIIGIDAGIVHSSSGLPFQASARLDNHSGGDFLMLMPSYGCRQLVTSRSLKTIRSCATRFRYLVGMDMGSWLLAAAGLLDGYRATIHRDEQLRFQERFPTVKVVQDRYVIDGKRLSCGGVITALELVLALIEAQHGATLRLQVASLFMLGEPSSKGRLPPELQLDGHRQIDNAVAYMLRHLEDPLPIATIATNLGLSQKKFAQLFVECTGRTPQSIYKLLRLLEVQRLVENTRESITTIALRCGYNNASAMTRAFRQEFGQTPKDVRNQSVQNQHHKLTHM